MKPNSVVVVILCCICAQASLPVAAGEVTRTYLHRSRGADLRAVAVTVTLNADGSTRYAIADFPFGRDESTIELAVGPDGKPTGYRTAANREGGYRMKLTFEADAVVLNREAPDKPAEEFTCPVPVGSLPDLNSRPDPYLTQHLLIRRYDAAKGGKQVMDVYDIDNSGKGLVAYKVSLELVDEAGVVLPNGKFKAKHFIQLQQSSADTWYKKHRGSQTDVWVSDDGAILRIYRHREPYELILQDYAKPEALISATDSVQGYPQPTVRAP